MACDNTLPVYILWVKKVVSARFWVLSHSHSVEERIGVGGGGGGGVCGGGVRKRMIDAGGEVTGRTGVDPLVSMLAT
jgi:hypothetical protein